MSPVKSPESRLTEDPHHSILPLDSRLDSGHPNIPFLDAAKAASSFGNPVWHLAAAWYFLFLTGPEDMYKCSVYEIYKESTPDCFITSNNNNNKKKKLISGQMLHNVKSKQTSAVFQNLATEPHDFNSTRPTFMAALPGPQCSETSPPSFLYPKRSSAIKGRGNEIRKQTGSI